MKRKPQRGRLRTACMQGAFTVLEILVSGVVLAVILGMLLSLISHTTAVTRRAGDKVSAFQAARTAFDLMTDHLSQATLNAYWDYDRPVNPQRYLRKSELHFVSGAAGDDNLPGEPGTGQAVFFQAPSGVALSASSYGGLENLLNVVGYFVVYGDEPALPEPFPPQAPKYRYRLMQAIEPTEEFDVYDSTSGRDWIDGVVGSANPLADNIIGMIVWPRKSPGEDPSGSALTLDYSYDSRANDTSSPQPETAAQLPPIVALTLVAIDEPSAARLCTGPSAPTEIATIMDGLFQVSSQTGYDDDLRKLEARLVAANLTYRIFTAMIPIRESKML